MNWFLSLFQPSPEVLERIQEFGLDLSEPLLAIPPVAVALIAALGPTIMDSLFGGPSSAEKRALGFQAKAAEQEVGLLQRRNNLADDLTKLAKRPAAAGAILKATGGKGFQFGALGEESNAADIFPHIAFTAEKREEDLRAILQSLGGGGTGAVNAGAFNAFNTGVNRSAALGDASRGIAGFLQQQNLQADTGGGGASGGSMFDIPIFGGGGN